MGDSKENLHAGHRTRLRQRFVEEGLDAFADHQVLELLLFFAIPRRDTNELAHALLRRYGSLAGVLDADPFDLAQTEGVGEAAATLLSLVPALARRYSVDRARRERQALTTSERAAEFLVPLMAGRTAEVFYVVCLDTQCRVIVPALVVEGLPDRAHIEPRQAVEAALRYKAHSVVLAHNHPTGRARPTSADHRVTQALVSAFGAIGIAVRDHLIVAGEDWYSFSRSGDLPAAKPAGGQNP
ncbi:MAG: DNA repair protein RadC [Deltaproteobacteria bacterium]|nr:DNA repair protein RadC [Deltaproteobacteria bacterium]